MKMLTTTLFDTSTGSNPVGILAKFWYPEKLEEWGYSVTVTT